MDKITKNPDNAKFTDSPRTSNVESQIEKFRQEVSKNSESEFINTRKLTIQSTVKHEPHESNEIDKQISDLECLIKRLQDEIVEMSKNADKSEKTPDDDNLPLEIKEDNTDKEEIIETEDTKGDSEPIDTNETNDHVYPVIVTDIGFSLNDQSQKFDAMVSDLVNFPDVSSSGEATLQKTFSSIRRDIDKIWSKENLGSDEAGENKAKEDDYHLQKLIGELKTEINEKLCSLCDVTEGERLNNSEVNLGNSSKPEDDSEQTVGTEPPDPPDD